MADKKTRILRQIDFYFGDSNLPKDKFLKGLVDSNPQGYIIFIINYLLFFNRYTCFIRLNYVIQKNEIID